MGGFIVFDEVWSELDSYVRNVSVPIFTLLHDRTVWNVHLKREFDKFTK